MRNSEWGHQRANVGIIVVVEILKERPLYEVSPQVIEQIADLAATLRLDIYDLRVDSNS